MGDMIQGGVKVFIPEKKGGFKKFYWDRYYNTRSGFL